MTLSVYVATPKEYQSNEMCTQKFNAWLTPKKSRYFDPKSGALNIKFYF